MTVDERVDFLVKFLDMLPHPEGGFYKETYRSTEDMDTKNGKRSLCTVIYFLLRSADVSRFHRIQSDEHWFWHEGSPVTIHLLQKNAHNKLPLGPADKGRQFPQQLVKALTIFGSTVDQPDSYALVSCVVAPGFDFRDFELFSSEQLLKEYPVEEEIIRRLT